ncbi:prephenate dehydrogenase [Sporolactobacillus kofuensis]|uniref:Prephenate dehydrogenase n=1 Tax=Sporolactobacillus kofuensis TaxID=269672 RepID=A0ABW1WD51_9BACL|nr:prephenate dehydrogenase/arogenate dehydrogenase family protein [Sporolactobacillus kofuensis]MCO7175220.1 prephenate dehydrogenase/arogenate dehydrogenase family protein [Sporolactobacillus kofuensis]
MKTIVIDGLGLIGGSLALAIKRQSPEWKIFAVDINQESLAFAKSRGFIDEGFETLDSIASQADLILLATPVDRILSHIKLLLGMKLKNGVIVTDVGSTKQQIMEQSKSLVHEGVTFIGGHPMSGSHKSGLRSARPDLFQKANYFLVALMVA